MPGHGEHAENAVSDPASSPSTSRCDDRAILQGGGNRAEESLRADAEQSPAPTVCRPARPRKPVDRYMLYRIVKTSFEGEVNVVQLLDAHVFARGYCLIGASSLYHFLRTCSFCCDFVARMYLLVSCLFDLKQLRMFCV